MKILFLLLLVVVGMGCNTRQVITKAMVDSLSNKAQSFASLKQLDEDAALMKDRFHLNEVMFNDCINRGYVYFAHGNQKHAEAMRDSAGYYQGAMKEDADVMQIILKLKQ